MSVTGDRCRIRAHNGSLVDLLQKACGGAVSLEDVCDRICQAIPLESFHHSGELLRLQLRSFPARGVSSVVGELHSVHHINIVPQQLQGEYCTLVSHVTMDHVRLNGENPRHQARHDKECSVLHARAAIISRVFKNMARVHKVLGVPLAVEGGFVSRGDREVGFGRASIDV